MAYRKRGSPQRAQKEQEAAAAGASGGHQAKRSQAFAQRHGALGQDGIRSE